MKKIKQLFCIAVMIGITCTTEAQLGGLLKKAKDKVNNTANQTNSSSNASSSNTSSSDNETQEQSTTANVVKAKELKWDRAFDDHDGGLQFGSVNLSVKEYTTGMYNSGTKNGKFPPYLLIRKENEAGTFHFAKDYPELADYTLPYNPGAAIEFSSTPFANGNAAKETHFNSSGHIYANIKSTNGNLKDALKIGKDGTILSVDILVFDKKNIYSGRSSAFIIKQADGNAANFIFDIMPELGKATQLSNGDNSIVGFYRSPFAQMHTQYNFPANGVYKIGVFLTYKLKDDWGKNLDEEYTLAGFFDYEFSIADAAKVKEEGEKVGNGAFEKSIKLNDLNKLLPAEWSYATNAITSGYSQQYIIDWALGKGKKIKLLKFYASDGSGYSTKSNEFGIPEYKYFNQGYTIFYKDLSDNQCYYVIDATISHKYTGGGTFEKTPSLSHTAIFLADCDKMK